MTLRLRRANDGCFKGAAEPDYGHTANPAEKTNVRREQEAFCGTAFIVEVRLYGELQGLDRTNQRYGGQGSRNAISLPPKLNPGGPQRQIRESREIESRPSESEALNKQSNTPNAAVRLPNPV
jgi:hypothetical protein